jgi:hypothetical protein
MSDPVKPAAAGKPSGDGGVGKAWGFAILAIVVVFSGVIGILGDQIGHLFQIMRMNAGPILGIAAVAFLMKGSKKGGDGH